MGVVMGYFLRLLYLSISGCVPLIIAVCHSGASAPGLSVCLARDNIMRLMVSLAKRMACSDNGAELTVCHYGAGLMILRRRCRPDRQRIPFPSTAGKSSPWGCAIHLPYTMASAIRRLMVSFSRSGPGSRGIRAGVTFLLMILAAGVFSRHSL